MPTGCVRNSLAPARMAFRINLPVGAAADHQNAAFRRRFPQVVDQLQGFVRVGIHADDADLRLSLPDDVGEELVPGGLGFQPAHVHTQEHLLERLPVGIIRIDDRQSKHVVMVHEDSCRTGFPPRTTGNPRVTCYFSAS